MISAPAEKTSAGQPIVIAAVDLLAGERYALRMRSEKSRFQHKILAGGLGLALAGCGGGNGTASLGANLTGPCTAPHSMCATVQLPPSYAQKPSKLMVAGFDRLPPAGPPSQIFATIDHPAISPTQPFQMEADNLQVNGSYYVYVVLYDQGGGQFLPAAGIDYVGATQQKVTFGDAPVNLGALTLTVQPAQ